MKILDLKGKNAFVIGGTGGIGLEIAKGLKDCGSNVTVAGRHSVENSDGLRTVFVDFDNGPDELKKSDVQENLKKCDILIFTYGPFVQKPLHQTTAEDWIKVALDDYALPGIAVSSVLPEMMKRQYGRIVLFGGTRTSQINPYRTNAAYGGAKTGISVIVKSISAEYFKYGITCNGILPGFTRNAPNEAMLVPEKSIANRVLDLIACEDLNGVLLNVDRGWQP